MLAIVRVQSPVVRRQWTPDDDALLSRATEAGADRVDWLRVSQELKTSVAECRNRLSLLRYGAAGAGSSAPRALDLAELRRLVAQHDFEWELVGKAMRRDPWECRHYFLQGDVAGSSSSSSSSSGGGKGANACPSMLSQQPPVSLFGATEAVGALGDLPNAAAAAAAFPPRPPNGPLTSTSAVPSSSTAARTAVGTSSSFPSSASSFPPAGDNNRAHAHHHLLAPPQLDDSLAMLDSLRMAVPPFASPDRSSSASPNRGLGRLRGRGGLGGGGTAGTGTSTYGVGMSLGIGLSRGSSRGSTGSAGSTSDDMMFGGLPPFSMGAAGSMGEESGIYSQSTLAEAFLELRHEANGGTSSIGASSTTSMNSMSSFPLVDPPVLPRRAAAAGSFGGPVEPGGGVVDILAPQAGPHWGKGGGGGGDGDCDALRQP